LASGRRAFENAEDAGAAADGARDGVVVEGDHVEYLQGCLYVSTLILIISGTAAAMFNLDSVVNFESVLE
jgi:hypothetical protein